MKKIRIGILGGSFNPPHIGHLLACQYALAVHDVQEVWMVPVKEHPFGKSLIDYWHRHEMCAMFKHYNSSIVVVNSDEKYMVDFLEKLVQQFPYYEPVLIVGSDVYGERDLWKGWERIEELAEIAVIYRQGEFLGDRRESDEEALYFGRLRFPNISSTLIREKLNRGLDVSNLIPRRVLEYIEHNKLVFNGT